MKKNFLPFILSAAVLAGCTEASDENVTADITVNTIASDITESTDITTVSSESVTEEPSESVTEAPPETVTETSRRKISPLRAKKTQSYFEDDIFSVTAEIKQIRSSLYYADIVGEKSAGTDIFVIEAEVCAKNVSYSEADFDISKITLSLSDGEIAPYDKSAENACKIKSGKKEKIVLRFLCSLSEASEIKEFRYDNMRFEPADNFISEEFTEALEIQKDPDIKTYLYRQYVVHCYEDYYEIPASGPSGIEAHVIGRVGENGEYFAVEYMIYNRTDYAMLIEPSAFMTALNDDENYGKALYISTDEKLMYQPIKKDITIDGINDIYEIPEFICMNDEGETKFTILYSAPKKINRWLLYFFGSHGDEDHYVKYESIIALNCDI